MNQVQEKLGIRGLMGYIKDFIYAISVNDGYVADPEEEVKKSGNEELIKSTARIKDLEAMYKDTELSKKIIRDNLKNINREELAKSPKIKGATFHTTETKTTEKKIDDSELEL